MPAHSEVPFNDPSMINETNSRADDILISGLSGKISIFFEYYSKKMDVLFILDSYYLVMYALLKVYFCWKNLKRILQNRLFIDDLFSQMEMMSSVSFMMMQRFLSQEAQDSLESY